MFFIDRSPPVLLLQLNPNTVRTSFPKKHGVHFRSGGHQRVESKLIPQRLSKVIIWFRDLRSFAIFDRSRSFFGGSLAMESAPRTLSPEILLTHAEFIRGLARRLIRDEQKAEDVAQDVWVAALEKPAGDVASVRAWLAGTARNLVRRGLRTEERARRRERAAARPERERSTDELIEAERARRRVVETLLLLREPYRSAILYRFYDDLPPRKIARRLGVPVETVKTRIQRGLDQLRGRLDSEYGAQAAWCLPLATAAGLKLTGTSSAILTGVLAMSVKLKIGIAAVLTAVLVGSLIYFWQPGPDGDQHRFVNPVAGERLQAPPHEGGDPEDGRDAEREPIAPGGADQMPASYRDTLGGFLGRVVEADGTPVKDRTVRLTAVRLTDLLQGRVPAGGDTQPGVDLKTSRALTDAEGVFHFGDVHPRAFHLLRVDRVDRGDRGGRADRTAGDDRFRRGFATRVVDAQPSPGEIVDLGDIVLGPCAILTGKVIDGAGAPLAGVRVRAADLPAELFREGLHTFREGCPILFEWRLFSVVRYVIQPPPAALQLLRMLPIAEARTAADGTFRVDGVPLGAVRLIADRERYVTHASGPINVTGRGAHDAGTITLDRGVTIKGQVQDCDNEPVAGVEICAGAVCGTSTFHILHPPVLTGSDGCFLIEGAERLPTLFALRAHRHDAWTFTGPLDPCSDGLVVRLGAAHDLRLKIIDRNRAAIDNASVRLREKSFQNIFPSNAPAAIDDHARRIGPGELVIERLAPGEYDLLVSAPGHGTAVEKVEIGNGPIEREVVLDRAAPAGVRVVAAGTGEPIEWAEIFVGADVTDWFEQGLRIVRGRTDAEGRAAFELACPGTYTVVAMHPGFAGGQVELKVPSEKEMVIALEPGGAVNGTVHLPEEIDALRHAIALDYRSGEEIFEAAAPHLAALDREGRFRIRNLEPGRYDVYLLPRLFQRMPFRLLDSFQEEPLDIGSVEIVSGETVDADFYAPTAAQPVSCGQVGGRVSVDGRPAPGAIVGVRYTSAKVKADEEGLFELGPVEAGQRFLTVTLPPLADGSPEVRVEREIEVVEGIPLFEVVEIVTGSIAGRALVYPGEKPLPGVRVRAWIPNVPPDLVGEYMESFRRGDLTAETLPQIPTRSAGPYQVSMETVTGVDGSFSFARVPVGVYQVRVETEALGSRAAEGVEVAPGRTAGPVELILYKPVAIEGWVRLPDSVRGAREISLTVYPEGAEPRNLLDLIQPLIFSALSGEVGGTRYSGVDRATGAFAFERMMPGSYKATLLVVFDDEPRGIPRSPFEAMAFVVPPEGVSDLILYPVPREEDGEN